MKQLIRSVLVIAFWVAGSLYAQEASSSLGSTRSIGRILGISPESSGKCGTSEMIMSILHWKELSEQRKASILKILQRPTRQKDRLSPSGRFRINYDTTGYNAPSLLTSGPNSQKVPNSVEQYIDSVAAVFDFAWNLEVGTLGFLPPPSDGIQGGGPEYDVYVSELGSSLFGQTLFGDMITSGTRITSTTYIEIDNDFLGMRTPGMDGLHITSAHEFHHAIQIGNYGYWTNVPNYDFYFYELSAVWMEHIAYNSIRDYYFDLPNYLERFRDSQNRSLSFSTYANEYLGYERSIWAQYLAKRFGRDIMRQVWTGIISDPVLVSTDKVLRSLGTSLVSEFSQFSYWNYFTADRAQSDKYYDDAADWPRFQPNIATTFEGLTSSVSSAGWPLSTQFFQFAVPHDTVTAIVVNVDAVDAIDPSPSTSGFQLVLSSSNQSAAYQRVSGGLSLSFLPDDKSQWKSLYLQSSTRSLASVSKDAFPNPIRISRDTRLTFPLSVTTGKSATFFFLNTALELIFSKEYDVSNSFGSQCVYVPTSDLRGTLPTGVYFVKARCGDNEFQWKVAVVR